jgi:hypothetical protein
MTRGTQRLGVATRGVEVGILPDGRDGDHQHSSSEPATIDQPVTLDAVLAALRSLPPLIARLTGAIEGRGVSRLAYRREELADALGISLRLVDLAIHRGELPQADLRIGRLRLWSAARLSAWIQQAGRRS